METTKNKLGQEPAFATQHTNADANSYTFKLGHSGMSKRFYAACAAMQGILSNSVMVSNMGKNRNTVETTQFIIEHSYVIADELLKQENQ